MLRRLHAEQPESFSFTPENEAWAQAQIAKYPDGRQASAIIALLWRAQEQEGWLTRPAIETVAEMLDLAYIRALEVATFYFMFQLSPVGSVAHVQVCGTLSCMICGAEDLVGLCKDRIAKTPYTLSPDGKFSWEEVECLGACSNAPMVQIGKDYYEDLTAESLGRLLDQMADGHVPPPGPQTGRFSSEPASGATTLAAGADDGMPSNASVALAAELNDTLKRIDGTETPLVAPWTGANAGHMATANTEAARRRNGGTIPHREDADGPSAGEPSAREMPVPAKPAPSAAKPAAPVVEIEPERLDSPDGGQADDLKRISGIGPKLEGVLNELGFWHFRQIAEWGPAEIEWVDARLKFKGRITRDDWVAQARTLAEQGA